MAPCICIDCNRVDLLLSPSGGFLSTAMNGLVYRSQEMSLPPNRLSSSGTELSSM
jgi:hypothetical protein